MLNVMIKQVQVFLKGNKACISSLTMLRSLSVWKESATRTPRITVSFVLPSGLEKGGFSVRVNNNGTKLEINLKWRARMTDLKLIHKRWLTSTTVRCEEYRT